MRKPYAEVPWELKLYNCPGCRMLADAREGKTLHEIPGWSPSKPEPWQHYRFVPRDPDPEPDPSEAAQTLVDDVWRILAEGDG